MEIRDGIVVYSTEMFQLARLFARSQVVVGDVGASMENQRFRLRSSARLPPEAYRIRRMFHVFDMDSRPVPSGVHCPTSRWRQCSAAAVLQKLLWIEYVAFTSRSRRDHLALKTRDSFGASADSFFSVLLSYRLGQFGAIGLQVIFRIYAVALRQESEKKGHEKRIVCAVHAFQLVFACFN